MAVPDESTDPLADIGRQARESSLGLNPDEPNERQRHKCYGCGVTATQICNRCRKRFCPRHGVSRPSILFGTSMTFECASCARTKIWIALAIAVLWLGGFAIWFIVK